MDQMMSQHKNKVMIVAIVLAFVVYCNMDWVKAKWNCVKNCYGSSSTSHMATVATTGTDGTSSVLMDNSVAAASAQMAATNSGLGVMYQPPSANGMYALGDPADSSDGLAAYSATSMGGATLAETISPLSPKDYNDSLAWLQAQQVQVQPELLPSNVSSEYTSLLSSVNFLSAGNTEGAITRPVFRNASQQDMLRPQVLIPNNPAVGGG